MKLRVVLYIITSCLLLSCRQDFLSVDPVPVHIRGIVTSTPLLPQVPGTHILTESITGNLYYLESRQFSLRSYEGIEVSLEGESSVHPKRAHPIIRNISILATYNEQTVQHTFSSFSFYVPKTFKVTHSGSQIAVYAYAKPQPVFTISTVPSPAPQGTSVLLGTTKALQVTQENVQRIYVTIDSVHYVFEYTELAHELSLRSAWDTMLKSIILYSSASSVDPVNSSTGTIVQNTIKKPCGGTAGILCDAGYYCQIVDMIHHVGQCHPL